MEKDYMHSIQGELYEWAFKPHATLHALNPLPNPSTLDLSTATFNRKPQSLEPALDTLNPVPCTLHPAPYTLYTWPYTHKRKPVNLKP